MSIDTELSASEELFGNFSEKEYRDAYVEADIIDSLALQIALTREARGWSQLQLGELAGMTQSTICRLEDPTYGKYSLRSLKRIASALDVALHVRLVPFSRLAVEADLEGPRQYAIPEFCQDSLQLAAAQIYEEAVSSCTFLSVQSHWTSSSEVLGLGANRFTHRDVVSHWAMILDTTYGVTGSVIEGYPEPPLVLGETNEVDAR